MMAGLFDVTGQGWLQLEELILAFVLSALVGLEREVRQKSAGLRTYSLVGVSAALFMLISKYGFTDVLERGRVVVDPSRVAAQVVSGIGFIGGGVIFMRRDIVRGLTTAASVWLTAALGMACGAGLPVLAVATTIGHFIIMLVFPKLVRYLPRERRTATRLRIAYEDGHGLLRDILVACTELRFGVDHVDVEQAGREHQGREHEGRGRDGREHVAREAIEDLADRQGTEAPRPRSGVVVLSLQVKGKRPVSHLIARLAGIAGVVSVGSARDDSEME